MTWTKTTDHVFCCNCGAPTASKDASKSRTPVFSEAESVDASCWFVPAMPREEAETLLAGKPEGTFLVRASQGNPGSYTLNVAGEGKTYNFLIKCNDGRLIECAVLIWQGSTRSRRRIHNPSLTQLVCTLLWNVFSCSDHLIDYHRRTALSGRLVLVTPALSAPRAVPSVAAVSSPPPSVPVISSTPPRATILRFYFCPRDLIFFLGISLLRQLPGGIICFCLSHI